MSQQDAPMNKNQIVKRKEDSSTIETNLVHSFGRVRRDENVKKKQLQRHIEKKVSKFKKIPPRFHAEDDASNVLAVQEKRREFLSFYNACAIGMEERPHIQSLEDLNMARHMKILTALNAEIHDTRSLPEDEKTLKKENGNSGVERRNSRETAKAYQHTPEPNVPEGSPTFQGPRRSSELKPPPGGINDGGPWKVWDFPESYENNRRVHLNLVLRDVILYAVFLANVTIVVLGFSNFTTYLYSIILSDVLTKTTFVSGNNVSTNFRNLKTIEELWTFIKEVYLKVIICKRPPSTVSMKKRGDLLYVLGNLVIGVPRIRQVRVKPDSCKIPSDFEGMFSKCYDYYSYYSEDRRPFGQESGSSWTFTDGIAGTFTGKVTTYFNGGYYLNFTRNCQTNKNEMCLLETLRWVDDGTRAVFLDFSVYSPNVNLFCVTKLVAELPPTGGVVKTWSFKTLKLIRYVTVWDYFILIMEILGVLFLCYYTVQEYRKITLFKWIYLQRFWNLIDLLIIILGWAVVVVKISLSFSLISYLPGIIDTIRTEEHGNLDYLIPFQEAFEISIAIIVAVMWFKLLKYMMLFKTIYHVLTSIKMILFELLGITFVLLILLISFSLNGYLLFGSQMEEFGSLSHSMMSMILLMVGALDYEEIIRNKPVMGTAFLALFIFLYVLVFVSLLIAILVNGFTMMRFQILEDRERVFLKEMLFKLVQSFLVTLRLKNAAYKVQQQIEKDKNREDFKIIIEILRRSGFRGKEVDVFLKKHNIKEGQPISDKKIEEVYEDIDIKGQLYMEAVEHEKIMRQVEELKFRMDTVDKMTKEMAAKVELLLDKIIHR